ncbi:MAG TPA: hypothetical protein PK014_01505 [Thermoanaerobaculia bacterium]|nr:hypothetical protein [Thermoanaerobaculia bacterium]HUM28630.1 hypothetical protein [Thermoanaerobaculia bacterium]HXK66762.1 hypothetical protein [Thermoanaerobaculia bacterium]
MQNLQRLENKYRAQLRKSRSNKDRIVLYIQLGNLYEKMSQKTNMMKSFNKAFSLAGYNPMKQPGKCCSSLSMNDVLPKMAEYYMERNDWKKAYKLWDNWNLCGIDVCDFGTPWNITLRESKLAECLIQMGKYKEAIEVIEDCLYRRKDPCGCVCLSGSPYDNKLRELLISIGDLDK